VIAKVSMCITPRDRESKMKRLLILTPVVAIAIAVLPATPAAAQKWYEKAVKKVEAKFTPAEAKPGQTVTFTVTVELNDGFHTYPTVQTDKQAAAMVNEIKFPDPGTLIFVGKVEDPKDQKTKSEPDLGILEMAYCTGTVTYTRKAVVSPKAAAGASTVKLTTFRLSVCDKDNCFPPKAVPVEAALKVLDGPAVEVEKAYAEEVKKALEK
jgi:plastocyanin